jgi:hypothetical protein
MWNPTRSFAARCDPVSLLDRRDGELNPVARQAITAHFGATGGCTATLSRQYKELLLLTPLYNDEGCRVGHALAGNGITPACIAVSGAKLTFCA